MREESHAVLFTPLLTLVPPLVLPAPWGQLVGLALSALVGVSVTRKASS